VAAFCLKRNLPILLYEIPMKTEATFNARLAGAGLVAGVGVALALLLVDGTLDGTWMLVGFLTLGLGSLLVGLIDRVGSRIFPDHASGEDAAISAKSATPAKDTDEATGPRLRVFVLSSLMQGVSLAFIAAYFSGSLAVGVLIGLLVGTLSLAVSTLLARKLSPV
jgi:hypothetical protein